MMLPRRHMLILAALLLVPRFAAGDVAGYGITIQRAELLRDESGKGYWLDANIDYRFSEPAIDALRNGVSLGMVLRIRVKPESGWWWAGTAQEEKLPFRISYHSLSKLYQIIYENNESPRNFVSFNALLENLGRSGACWFWLRPAWCQGSVTPLASASAWTLNPCLCHCARWLMSPLLGTCPALNTNGPS